MSCEEVAALAWVLFSFRAHGVSWLRGGDAGGACRGDDDDVCGADVDGHDDDANGGVDWVLRSGLCRGDGWCALSSEWVF